MKTGTAVVASLVIALSAVLTAAPASACHGQTVEVVGLNTSWTDNNMSPNTVTLEPPTQTVTPGQSYEYHIKMTLTPGCGSNYFLYASLGTVPAGWRATYTTGPGGTGDDLSNVDNKACGNGNVVINAYLNVTAPDWAGEGETAIITAMIGADDNARNDKDLVYVKTRTKVHIPDPPVVVANPIPDFEMPEDTEDSTRINLATVFKDTDNDPITFGVNTPNHFTVKILGDGRVTIAPNKDWNGMEVLSFWCTDGITRAYDDVAVTVTPVPDPPVVAAPMKDFAIPEDGEDGTTVTLSRVFYDADVPYGDRLTYTFTGQENISVTIKADTKVLFRPPPGWSGKETIVFTARDLSGASVSDDVEVLVTDSSRPPYIRMSVRDVTIKEDGSDSSIDLKEVFADSDADSVLEFGCEGASSIHVEISNGVVTLTPAPNWNGVEVLQFWASDGMFSPVFDDCKVTVTPVNDPPFQKEPLSIEFEEDSSPDTIFLDKYFGDVDGDKLTYSTRSPQGLTVTIYSRTNEMSLSPALNFNGELTISLKVSDGQDEIQVTVPVRIISVDDPPIITDWLPGGNVVCTEGDELTFKVSAVDVDGDELGVLWEIDQCFTHLKRFEDKFEIKVKALAENGLGPGTWTLTAWVDGGEKASVPHSWSVTVRHGNRPPSTPVITSPDPSKNYTSAQELTFSASSEDPDGDLLSYRWLIDGVEVSTSQSFLTKLPVGLHKVKVTVSDGRGGVADSQEMMINILKPPKRGGAGSTPGFEALALASALAATVVLLRKRK
ncbi:MAG: tandem-95 repeat protein [Thermoplasmata archaeon]